MAERSREFASLRGRRVEPWVGVEMALRVLAEVHLLIAGELEETFDGGLLFRRLDESVLVFTDPVAAAHVPWTSPRQGFVRTA